ncbi:hypothetical protein [Sphingomonas sp. Mn802worker]|uniref:hypothetical protein n=1 Tax=Sphingomonas sp. Mn802worker TaxID=629773 RepID=UPI00036F7AE4|nr:hypothetical protein [Sphingomonas sp. Mn802worker]
MFAAPGSRWSAAAFVCDATNRDHVLVLSAPTNGRRVRLWALAKPGLAATGNDATLGRGDPGMNQIYYPLTGGGGEQLGWVHALNPAIVEPGATTPAVTSVKWGQQITNCRFAPQTRVLGVTPRRSVQITATPTRGYLYRSYNDDARLAEIEQPWGGRDTHASLTIANGQLLEHRGARNVYHFTNNGYTYRVFVSTDPLRGGGGVQVLRGDRVLMTEPFGAYTAAVQP